MIINQFYKELLDHLMVQNDIGLAHFDKYNVQLQETEEGEVAFNMPAGFLQINNELEWRSVGRHKMIAVCTFTILVFVESYLESDSNAEPGERDDALSEEQIINAITRQLVGLSGQVFNSISRINLVNDEDHDQVKGIAVSFRTLLTDRAAQRDYVSKKVPPELSTGIDKT